MNEEQKIRGGGNPELNDAALDAVTGGSALNPDHNKPWDQKAWDWVGELYGAKDDNKEEMQQP